MSASGILRPKPPSPTLERSRQLDRVRAIACALVIAVAAPACQKRPVQAPGETSILVEAVDIVSADPSKPLSVPFAPLPDRLGMRPGSLINTPRYWSSFREADDRRRIEAFWQQFGYLDVKVAQAESAFSADGSKVHLTFRITENERFHVADVKLEGAPKDEEEALAAMIFFSRDTKDIDLEKFRRVRNDMADHLRKKGFGHANVYSRAYVDRAAKTLTWYYFVDAGPRTKIGKIVVQGNHRVSADRIIERTGLRTGDPYVEGLRVDAEHDLLDTGSFASAFTRVDADTKFIPPGTAPDTGGELRDEQVDVNGNLVPRKLPEDINVTLHVVEAPQRTLRARASAEIDPARADTALAATLWFRNIFGTMHHVAIEGRIGYGWLFDTSLRQPGLPVGLTGPTGANGLYGDLTVRSIFPGLIGRKGDFRVTGQVRTELYPGAYLTELSAGPGVRSTIAQGLFFDLDLLYRYASTSGFSGFSAADTDRLALPTTPEALGPELQTSILLDRRDNPVEALKGYLLGLRARFAPGDPLGTHRYLNLAPEARGFLPVSASFSIAAHVAAEWSLLNDAAGTPLGIRLFGGGPYGFRGFGRQRLSPTATSCAADGVTCAEIPVGGRSLFEAAIEGRLLPFQKQYGLVAFMDFGGAGPGYNPFEEGLTMAGGLGVRLRIWYVPLAVDVAYRFLERGGVTSWEQNPLGAFVRIGEAF